MRRLATLNEETDTWIPNYRGRCHGSPTSSVVHHRDRRAEGAARPRHLEYAPSSPRRACLYHRQPLTQSLGGRTACEAFLTRKWQGEFDYCLIKEIRAFSREPRRRALRL